MARYQLDDFDYTLPEALIAQFPTKRRVDSRLFVLSQSGIAHRNFTDFIDLISPGDLLVFNDTKVIPARLEGVKETGGKVSCLIERLLSETSALAHIRASHAPVVGSKILFESIMEAVVIKRRDGLFELQFTSNRPLLACLEEHGKIPLPPYISREPDHMDVSRYQTVYAKYPGAVAAPTAGLHFDERTLAQLQQKNVEMGFLTLHVGAGTFQPVRVNDLDAHHMHSEYITVSAELCAQVHAAKARGNRVIAIGTTAVRALESAAQFGEIQPFFGDTRLFIHPGYVFRCVDAIFTNFHLPKSTLLMLVCAFGGYSSVMTAYTEAIKTGYRFFSYGDAMFLI